MQSYHAWDMSIVVVQCSAFLVAKIGPLKPFIIILGIKNSKHNRGTTIKGILNMYEKLSIFTFNTRIVNYICFKLSVEMGWVFIV